MTIRIIVTNEDSRENAVVQVRTVSRGQKTLLPLVSTVAELKGGESTESYVHDGQSLIVEEIQNG